MKAPLLFSLITLMSIISHALPEGAVCLRNISDVTCKGNDSDTFYGNAAYATCTRTALIRRIDGSYSAIQYEGKGRAYSEGSVFTSDGSIALENATADVQGRSAEAALLPLCSGLR